MQHGMVTLYDGMIERVQRELQQDMQHALQHDGYLPKGQPTQMEMGDDFGCYIAPLVRLARAHGFPVFMRPAQLCEAEGFHGRTEYALPGHPEMPQRITLANVPSKTHQFRVLTHEVAHVLTGPHHTFPLSCGPAEFRARAEVIAEMAAYLTCASVGLDIQRKTVAYLKLQPFACHSLVDHVDLIHSITMEMVEVLQAIQREVR